MHRVSLIYWKHLLGHSNGFNPSIAFDQSKIFQRGERRWRAIQTHVDHIRKHVLANKECCSASVQRVSKVSCLGRTLDKNVQSSLLVPTTHTQEIFDNLLHRLRHSTSKPDCYDTCCAFNGLKLVGEALYTESVSIYTEQPAAVVAGMQGQSVQLAQGREHTCHDIFVGSNLESCQVHMEILCNVISIVVINYFTPCKYVNFARQ